MLTGNIVFGLVYVNWAIANQGWHVLGLFLLYGIYAAATDGVGKALVTELAPQERRGVALGWFNGLTGLAALPANLLGGWVWATYRPAATFLVGASFAFLATVLLLGVALWLHASRTD